MEKLFIQCLKAQASAENIDATVGFVITLIFVSCCVTLTIIELYKNWVKQKELEIQFYKWKGTNKSKIWFICWSSSIAVNIPILIVIFLLCRDMFGLALSFFIVLLYSNILRLIYIIVKNYVRYYHDKDEPK